MMTKSTLWERITGWFGFLPVRLAYRIIWITARLGGRTAKAVELAMWVPRYTADEWRSVGDS